MSNSFFKFKQFTIHQERCAMKVGTDGVLLGAWVNIENCSKILDVGTGTGIIALMMAQRCGASIDTVEIELEAYLQATENIAQCPWHDRLSAVHSSFQDYSNNTPTRYDLIVSNPPFFKDSLKARGQNRNIARHNDSLSHKDLIESSLRLLKPNGRLAIIMPFAEGSIVIAEASKKGLFCVRKTNVKSVPNTPVFRLLMEFSQVPAHFNEDFLVIGTGEPERYSDKYVNLTKEFYLNY